MTTEIVIEMIAAAFKLLQQIGADKPDFDRLWSDAGRSIKQIDADVTADEATERIRRPPPTM